MIEVHILQLSFTPETYFEEPVIFSHGPHTVKIEKGQVEVRVPPEAYDQTRTRDEVHALVEAYFMGAQLKNCTPFTLSKASVYHQHHDGRRDATIFPESIVSRIRVGQADLQVIDKDGNVVSDTRATRIAERNRLSELAAQHIVGDRHLRQMMRSHDEALKRPDVELVRLFEIREALVARFGSEQQVKSSLGISHRDWSELGRLANDAPVRQGRHVGKKTAELRDATDEERGSARRIATDMVRAYLEYLNEQKQ